MVVWPCLLTLEGDDELIYLAEYSDFMTECKELIFTDDDYIIDSTGQCYFIDSNLNLYKSEQCLSTEEVTALIRLHEFSKAQVCLTKIYFLSVEEAVKSMVYEVK